MVLRDCQGYKKPAGKCHGFLRGTGMDRDICNPQKPVLQVRVWWVWSDFKLRSKQRQHITQTDCPLTLCPPQLSTTTTMLENKVGIGKRRGENGWCSHPFPKKVCISLIIIIYITYTTTSLSLKVSICCLFFYSAPPTKRSAYTLFRGFLYYHHPPPLKTECVRSTWMGVWFSNTITPLPLIFEITTPHNHPHSLPCLKRKTEGEVSPPSTPYSPPCLKQPCTTCRHHHSLPHTQHINTTIGCLFSSTLTPPPLKTSTYAQFRGWLIVFQQHHTTPLKTSVYAHFQCFPSPPPSRMSSYTRFRWWLFF